MSPACGNYNKRLEINHLVSLNVEYQLSLAIASLVLIHSPLTAPMSASLIGHLQSSTFRLSTTAVSMSLTGSYYSSESAAGPFHYGIRERGETI